MRLILSVLFLVNGITSHIEDTLHESKPARPLQTFPEVVVDFDDLSPTVEDYDDDVSAVIPSPASTFIGRRRRAIADPIADYLDEKASSIVFHDAHRGPPAPPPPDYNEVSSDNTATVAAPAPRDPAPRISSVQSSPKVLPPHSRVTPYDINVDPDFPAEAPRARGLVNVPEGWNLGRQQDWEFKAGYRWNTSPAGSASGRNWDMGLRGAQSRASVFQQSQPTAQFSNDGGQQMFTQQSFMNQPSTLQFGQQAFGQQGMVQQPLQQWGGQNFGQQAMVQQTPQQPWGGQGMMGSAVQQASSFGSFDGR